MFCKKVVLKSFAKFTKKTTLSEPFFFIKIAGLTLSDFNAHSVKKDANTGVFLSILRNFMNSFFYRTRPVATSVFQRFPVLLQNTGKEWREFRISNQVEYLRWHFSAKRVNSLIHLWSSQRRCSVRKAVLRNFAKFLGKHLCQSLFLNNACNFIKKATLAQVFSYEFCEISKNTSFIDHLWETASYASEEYYWHGGFNFK